MRFAVAMLTVSVLAGGCNKFAGEWRFRWKLQRRGEWTRGLEPTLEMWEHVLDSLKRRYRRREGVTDEDLEAVRKELAALRDPPAFDGEE